MPKLSKRIKTEYAKRRTHARDLIWQIREMYGLTDAQIAERLGVSPHTVFRLRHAQHAPRPKLLKRLLAFTKRLIGKANRERRNK